MSHMYSNERIRDIADAYGVFTYKDPLIYNAYENINNWRDREGAVRLSPMLSAYIERLDQEIFSEKPICEPDIFQNKTITQEWNEEYWDDLLITIFNKARTHRYCIVQLYNQKPYWRVFYERQIKELIPDDYGNIIGAVVEWDLNIPKNDKYLIFTEELKFYPKGSAILITNGKENDADGAEAFGKSDLEAVWTTDVYIRYCLQDIAANSAKTSGFYHLVYGTSIDDDKRDDLLNALDMAGSMRGIGATKQVLEDIKYHTPSKPEFTVNAFLTFLRAFANASRLPLSFYWGEAENAGLFDDRSVDVIKTNRKKRAIFKRFRSAIVELIQMRWGIILDDIYPNIEEMKDEEYKEEIKVSTSKPKEMVEEVEDKEEQENE